ncbi:sodium:solute symporter family protein [Pseudoflavonifractor phocaeensis]|uniref:sodium:solute symporter family protein n=1 Tax=Pseudoflavonifractor phocaeensis TaxID=1870988 RepID=UPI001958E4A7|nr:sodium:solute symporter [Pseudoflavonifractor phocaeensis]MBM6926771.1 sodium:solute symporter [Pseudoflavonifractor phocaeensis]
MFIKGFMLVVFFAVMVGIGLYCRRHTTDVNGFVLGGRSVGPWLTAFAYGTSYFSAVVFVGYAGQFGWKYGIAATWAGLGNAFLGSLLAWAVLGRRTRVMTQHLDSATMPEFFGKRFGSRSLKLTASVIIFVFLIPYTASLYNGLSRLFAMAFDIDYAVCVIVMAVLTGIYVIAGGYMATAINDFIQGIIMLVGICAVIGAVLNSQGGFLAALDGLARVSDPATSDTPGVFASFFGPDPVNLLGVVLLTSLGTWGLPQMVQKFYAIKSEKSINTGMVVSTAFAVVVAGGCYFLGGFGRLFSTPEAVAAGGYDSIIPTMLSGLPAVLIAVVVILVLSASMSTLSSLVLASSSTLTLDFIKGNLIKDMDEGRQVRWMRALVVVFIAISVVLAIIQYTSNVTFIAQLMGVSWGALAGAFLAPFLYGLYWKRTTKAACVVSFLFSTVVMLANIFFGSWFPAILQSPINCGAFCMLAGLVLVPVVSLVSKAPANREIQTIFACYERTVTVTAKDSIGRQGETKVKRSKARQG